MVQTVCFLSVAAVYEPGLIAMRLDRHRSPRCIMQQVIKDVSLFNIDD